VLQRFINNPEIKPLQANSPEALVERIRWVSTVVPQSASSPHSQGAGGTAGGSNVPIPQPGSGPIGPDVW